MLYLNTAFSSSMVPDGDFHILTVIPSEVPKILLSNDFKNVCNPKHSNTLALLGQVLGFDVSGATGERVKLSKGDTLVVAELDAARLPRETREYTDEEIAACTLVFRVVQVK